MPALSWKASCAESLPLLRRSLSAFDNMSRRRLLDKLKRGPQQTHALAATAEAEANPAFAAALPLLNQILGIEEAP